MFDKNGQLLEDSNMNIPRIWIARGTSELEPLPVFDVREGSSSTSEIDAEASAFSAPLFTEPGALAADPSAVRQVLADVYVGPFPPSEPVAPIEPAGVAALSTAGLQTAEPGVVLTSAAITEPIHVAAAATTVQNCHQAAHLN
jgi:hypothetical protein